MKKILIPIWLLGLAAGCQEAPVEASFAASETAVRFVGAGPAATRTVVEADGTEISVVWGSDDVIGIFGRGATAGNNYPYAAAPERNEPSQCTFASTDMDKIFKWNRGEQAFYAYYPYAEDADAEPNALPVVLPTQQMQNGPGSTEHLAGLGVMKAAPVTRVFSEEDPAPVGFTFRNLFAMVEIRLKMAPGTAVDVPVRRIRLLSEAAPLTIGAGTVDLTAPVADDPLDITDGKKEAVLVFGEQPVLNKTDYQSFWLMLAPGRHPEGTLALEVTAIDNSTCTTTLPAVAFKANCNYRQDAALSLDEFVPAEAFNATAAVTECRVGEPVVFALSGEAETVDFYSGEKFHQWEYADKDRLEYSDVFFSFRAQMQGGAQLHPLTVKVSTDFDGTFEEPNILTAAWTDVTTRFTLPTKPWTANNGPNTLERYLEEGRMIPSGEVNLSAYYDEKSPYLYVAFFYHVDKYDATLKNSRPGIWFTDIMAVRAEGDTRIPILSQTKETVHIVNGDKYAEGEAGSDWQGTPYEYNGTTISPLRMWCVNNPPGDRDAYAVMNKLERKVSNFGPDKPESVKGGGTEMPRDFSYAFAEPGTYETVLVGRSKTLTDETETVCRFTVTVKP